MGPHLNCNGRRTPYDLNQQRTNNHNNGKPRESQQIRDVAGRKPDRVVHDGNTGLKPVPRVVVKDPEPEQDDDTMRYTDRTRERKDRIVHDGNTGLKPVPKVAVKDPEPEEDEVSMNDIEGSMEGTDEGTGINQAAEPEVWHEIKRTKDLNYRAAVPREFFPGTKEKSIQLLRETVWNYGVNITEGPEECEVSGKEYYRFRVESEEDLQKVLDIRARRTNEDGIQEEMAIFNRMDTSSRDAEIERTVEVCGLHPRTEIAHIQSAFVRFGEVERIITRPHREGWRISAKVLFKTNEAIQKIKEKQVQHVQIGNNLARLSWIGGERLVWNLAFIAKLTGLPRGMHSAELLALIGQDKASFAQIPWGGKEGQKNTHQIREAYVYFSTQETMDSVTKSKIRIADGTGTTLHWAGVKDKRCYECGAEDHIQWKCPKALKEREVSRHKRNVRAFSKGGAIQVVGHRTFAQVAGGETPQVTEKRSNSNEEQQQRNKNQRKVENGDLDLRTIIENMQRAQEAQQQQFQEMISALTSMVMQTIPIMTQIWQTMSVQMNKGNSKNTDDKLTGDSENKERTPAVSYADIPAIGETMAKLVEWNMNFAKGRTERLRIPETPQHKMEVYYHGGREGEKIILEKGTGE